MRKMPIFRERVTRKETKTDRKETKTDLERKQKQTEKKHLTKIYVSDKIKQ